MIAVTLVLLSALILIVELARNHTIADATVLVLLLIPVALAARWLLRDLRVHPTNFPAPTVSQGLRIAVRDLDDN